MDQSAPLSLYLDLEKGHIADIEVVSRAAIAWSQAVKELAYIADPSIEVRVELLNGTEGSLSLNSIVRVIKQTAANNPKLTTVIITCLTWFALETSSYTLAKIYDYLLSDDAPAEARSLSDSERTAVAEEVVRIVREQTARQEREAIFRELARDPKIRGVGVTTRPGQRPAIVVPRSEFQARSGQTAKIDIQDAKRRSTTEIAQVTLVSPILKDAERRWRFQIGALPEFGATMKDHEFLEGVAKGDISIPLRIGIEMEVELETKEELEDQLWVVKERNVLRVLSPKRARHDLFAPQR
jgi:hypothetical protein